MNMCIVCGSKLTGRQIKTCSIKCRNVVAGRSSGKNRTAFAEARLPNAKWFASKYLLPPRGEGLTTIAIGNELGITDVRVQQILHKYNISEPQNIRTAFHRAGKATWRKEKPPKEELENLYLMPPNGSGWTLRELAEHYKVNPITVRRWLKAYDLTQPFILRHSSRMAGDGNPAWNGGISQNYQAGVIAHRPKVCEWCGTSKKIQVHHVDHDRSNGNDANLMWLCHHCNMLEAHLYNLTQKGRATFKYGNGRIVITFNPKEQEHET